MIGFKQDITLNAHVINQKEISKEIILR